MWRDTDLTNTITSIIICTEVKWCACLRLRKPTRNGQVSRVRTHHFSHSELCLKSPPNPILTHPSHWSVDSRPCSANHCEVKFELASHSHITCVCQFATVWHLHRNWSLDIRLLNYWIKREKSWSILHKWNQLVCYCFDDKNIIIRHHVQIKLQLWALWKLS
jgi:hypothetical protein